MFFDKDKKKEPESENIWKDFNNAETASCGWCCKLLGELIKAGNTHFYISIPPHKGEVVSMKINFCIRCGRRLNTPLTPLDRGE